MVESGTGHSQSSDESKGKKKPTCKPSKKFSSPSILKNKAVKMKTSKQSDKDKSDGEKPLDTKKDEIA